MFLATLHANEPTPCDTLTEFHLTNGIHVFLKPTPFDDDEVNIYSVAPGGFASGEPEDRFSAELSPLIAWESGIGNLDTTQLSQNLFDLSLEFAPYIRPYHHGIDAASHRDQVGDLLKLFRRLYTEPHFSEQAMNRVIARASQSIAHRELDPDQCFDDTAKKILLSNSPLLRPMNEADLRKADFETAKAFYEQEFLNTKDLTVIIVGDFDPRIVRPLVEQHLGALPSGRCRNLRQGEFPSFPPGISKMAIKGSYEEEVPVRLTFPLSIAIDEKSLASLELTTQVIETRLRHVLIKEKGTSQAIDVGYELPAYPHFDRVWLTLQFRSPSHSSDKIVKRMVAELKNLSEEGPSPEEVTTAILIVQHNDEFWKHENSYWLSTLINCSQWGWDPNQVIKQDCTSEITPLQVRDLLLQNLNLLQYNVIKGIK